MAEPTSSIAAFAPDTGRVVGELANGEDRAKIAGLLHHAVEQIGRGELELLCHQDLEPTLPATDREAARRALWQALVAGQLGRFAVRVPTAAGPRIAKIAEAGSLGSRLLGLVGSSRARREHRLTSRGERLGVAAAPSCGFLELWHGPVLQRSCQVQAVVQGGLEPLGPFLSRELATHGLAAIEAFGRALADAHAVPFFHSDLKAFHAFASDVSTAGSAPASYRLRFIDLDRVAFWMSPRKRVINLYQALRYIVPDEPTVQEAFVFAYCARSGWHARAPARALAQVRRFLEYKLRTHRYP
jgi:hypothetical protein